MTTQRYYVYRTTNSGLTFKAHYEPDNGGDWVKYSDHAATEAELYAVQDQVTGLQDLIAEQDDTSQELYEAQTRSLIEVRGELREAFAVLKRVEQVIKQAHPEVSGAPWDVGQVLVDIDLTLKRLQEYV